MGKILLGTSGWMYKDWIGPFYKKEEKSMLSAYSKVFRTVEIDSTFYRYPSKGTVMGWLKYSPPDFVFTAKLPKLITHDKKLDLAQGVEDDCNTFFELMQPLSLGGKLGCILIQLPPRFELNLDLLENFLKVLPRTIKFAIEFRDLSWLRDETWDLLKKYEVAYTIVDEPLLPPEVRITSSIAYFRWHGRGGRPWYNYRYKVEELEPWVPRVKEVSEKAEVVYGYFNNHYHGYAAENCLQVLEMLGILTPEQAEAKERIENYFRAPVEVKKPTIEAFVEPKKMKLESLLNAFIDKERLKRAQRIKDEELIIQELSEDHVKASIREYHIAIDMSNKLVLHDCADWSRCIPSKKFCKHLGKLFLSLSEEDAVRILSKIYVEKSIWEFKPYTS